MTTSVSELRPSHMQRFTILVVSYGPGIFLFGIAGLVVGSGLGWNASASMATVILVAILAGYRGTGSVRVQRASDSLTVQNAWRKSQCLLGDVVGVVPCYLRLGRGTVCLALQMSDGRTLPMLALISSTERGYLRQAQRCRELLDFDPRR